MHISKQCFALGQLDGGLLAGHQDHKWEGELSDASYSHRSFALWDGMSTWPSIWRLASDILSTRSLNLAAMDIKLVAVNWNSRFSHSIWVQRPWQDIKTNHLVWVSHILVMLFGTPFICHQWGSLSDVGMTPTWEKGSHLPLGTTKLCNLRESCNSATAPTAKPDPGFSSSMLGECCSVVPNQGCQKCDRVLHRYTRWTGRLSHQTSNSSHPHNPLPKGCDLYFAQYWVQGDAGKDLPG